MTHYQNPLTRPPSFYDNEILLSEIGYSSDTSEESSQDMISSM